MTSLIPPGKTFRDLKTASADFNRSGGDYDARLCYLLACIADGVARTAVNKCDAIAAAMFYAGGDLCIIGSRLHRITGGFIRDAFGEGHNL